jgi:hypothetical protein
LWSFSPLLHLINGVLHRLVIGHNQIQLMKSQQDLVFLLITADSQTMQVTLGELVNIDLNHNNITWQEIDQMEE